MLQGLLDFISEAEVDEIFDQVFKDGPWQPLETIPRDGTKVDVWCVHPNSNEIGVRFTNVQMRGDGSGFGFTYHTEDGAQWEYIEREEGIYPLWIITHWMPVPEGPKND